MKFLKTLFLKVFLPLLAMFFLITIIQVPNDAAFCLTEKFCLSMEKMGRFYYTLSISSLATAFLIFLALLRFPVKYATVWAFMKRPFLTWGVIGGGSFIGLALITLFFKNPDYYTDFQTPLIPYIATLDLLIAGIIVAACVIKSRAKEKGFGVYAKVLAFLIFNGFFLNMLTLPTGVNSWSNFLPFALIVGVIDLLLLSTCFKRKKK